MLPERRIFSMLVLPNTTERPKEIDVEIKSVAMEIPEGSNVIIGHTHFIKSVEDLYEIMVGMSAQVKFGIAFCEASGPCLIRVAGNDDALQAVATKNAQALAAGHSFVILLKEAYPINFLNAIKQCPEVCTIYCATANPVQAIVAETEQGRGILGVVDGFSPKGVECETDAIARRDFLRQIGYKL
jgi:adenosine/AMP kinase